MAHPAEFTALLHVHVDRGARLRDTDVVSKIDPYVHIVFGECVSISDTHDEAGANCVFNWSADLPFNTTNTNEKLKFVVYDANTGRQDSIVGSGEIAYNEIIKAKGKDHALSSTVKLSAPGMVYGTVQGGELYVQLWWEDLAPNTPLPTPTLRLVVNINHTAGLVRNIVDGGSFEPVDSFQIRLWDVGSIFNHQTSHWNVNYDAAQKIYGSGPQCLAIRSGLCFEHGIMYNHENRTGGTYTCHMIQGLQQFIDKLPLRDKNTTPDHCVRFTYVILADGHMNFSITSKKSGRDFLSKHALHSCAAETLMYAGEFWIDRKSPRFAESNKPALIIDNNSGTFAPAKERLPLLKQVLERNFGTDLPILTFDRSDPELKHYFDCNNID